MALTVGYSRPTTRPPVRRRAGHRGQSVILSIWRLHRSERYWPDPDKFDPDRWYSGRPLRAHAHASRER